MSLDAELEMSDGVVTGTRCPTGHYLLIDARFELPFGKFSFMEMCGSFWRNHRRPPCVAFDEMRTTNRAVVVGTAAIPR